MAGHTRTGSLAHALLKGIGMTGVFLFSGRNVNRALWRAQKWGREFENKKWRDIKKSLDTLKHRGLVTLTLKADGTFEAKITKQGKEVKRKIDIDNLQIPKPPKWDGRWRVAIFDVPNTAHKRRSAFSRKLKEVGFRMVQKSVWIYPYPCDEEIMILRNFFGIESHVTYIETALVEDEDIWRQKFDLEFKKE